MNNTVDDDVAMALWQKVGFSNRYMFRLVMENPELCKKTLEVVLDMKIKSLEYVEAEKSVETRTDSKGTRLDVYIEDSYGNAYDLEMQSNDDDGEALGKRTRYYQSLMDQSALKKGAFYDDLRRSMVIFICKYDPFGFDFLRYTFTNRCQEKLVLELDDESTKIFINTMGLHGDEREEFLNFIDFVNTGKTNDAFTRDLAKAVEKEHMSKEKAARYMTWEQEIMAAERHGAKKERVIWEKKLADKDAKIANQKAEIATLMAKLEALQKK